MASASSHNPTSTSSYRHHHSPSSSQSETLARLDDDIKEYLLYRGFTKTMHIFQMDLREDPLKVFHVEKVLAQIFEYVHNHDIANLLRLWNFLDRRLFAHLDAQHSKEIHKMKISLLRYYVIYAIKSDRREKAIAFLATYTLPPPPSSASSSSSSSTGTTPTAAVVNLGGGGGSSSTSSSSVMNGGGGGSLPHQLSTTGSSGGAPGLVGSTTNHNSSSNQGALMVGIGTGGHYYQHHHQQQQQHQPHPSTLVMSSNLPPQVQAETDAAWRHWFVLPHLKDPERDPQFHVFFSNTWAETFRISLHNILSVIFSSAPLPKLFTVRRHEDGQTSLKTDLAKARQEAADSELKARHLQDRLMALTSTMKDMISFVQNSTEKANKSLMNRPRVGSLFTDAEEDEREANKRSKELRDAGVAAAKAANDVVGGWEGGGRRTPRGGMEEGGGGESFPSTTSSSMRIGGGAGDTELIRRVEQWLSLLHQDMGR